MIFATNFRIKIKIIFSDFLVLLPSHDLNLRLITSEQQKNGRKRLDKANLGTAQRSEKSDDYTATIPMR